MFDPLCMARLKRILTQGQAQIVLSSSWRQSEWGLEEVNKQLQQHGMPSVIDMTPVHGFRWVVAVPALAVQSYRLPVVVRRSRSDEILDWIHRHPEVRHFVALDDMDLTCAACHTHAATEHRMLRL